MAQIRVGVRYRNTIDIVYLREEEAKEIQEIIEGGITESEIAEIAEILSKARKREDTKTYKVNWFIDLTEPEDEQFDDTRFW